MKVLLDECLPRKLKRSLLGHDCQTVPEAGFAGMRNGELLSSAEKAGFDVFLTLDRGIEFQQRLKNRNIGIVLLRSKTSRCKTWSRRFQKFWLQLSRSAQVNWFMWGADANQRSSLHDGLARSHCRLKIAVEAC